MSENLAQKLSRASKSPLAFLDEFGVTFDPRTKKKDLDFNLYPFQRDYVEWLTPKIETGGDGFVEKSRDMGVSWLSLYVIFWFWFFKKGFQALVGSRKENYVDNRSVDSLFGKFDYILRHLPFVPEGFVYERDRTFMKLVNPSLNNTILGESANANFSRAGRYNLVFFDELAFWPFQQSSWEAAGDATPCRLAVTTPSHEPSFAKALRNSGLIDIKTLHWKIHPLKDDDWYEQEKLRRTKEEIARELDINWEGSLEGIVYPEVEHATFGEYPFLPQQPLYVSWDFGLDRTSIEWWQLNQSNGKMRLIHAYEKSDKVLEYFFPLFGNPINSLHAYSPEDISFFSVVGQLPKAIHFGDPDIAKRNIQTGVANADELAKVGIFIQTNAQKNNLNDRKTAAKLLLQKGVEVNDTPQTRFAYECWKNARYPRRLDTSQAVTENIKPIHDWTEGHRTALEYFAVNYQPARREKFVYERVEGFNDLGFSHKYKRRKKNRWLDG